MLEKFARAKSVEIKKLQRLKDGGGFPPRWTGKRQGFGKSLKKHGPGTIIAEYKRASPSKGEINMSMGPVEVARAYKEAGAGCLSVLTEEVYFKGKLSYLFDLKDIGLPLLRKDFIIHPLQVEETASTPASALLLIVRMFKDPGRLRELYKLCTKLGLEAVFEIFEEQELNVARKAGARIIQVNNRDLSSLTVDLSLSEKMIRKRKNSELWICASGLSKRSQLRRFTTLGFDGLLIGSTLMGCSDPGKCLRALLGRE